MALRQLYPVAVSTDNAWTLAAGADKPTACRTGDGDATYIRHDAGGDLAQTFQVDTLPSGAVSGSLFVVSITKLLFTSGAATYWNRIREGGSVLDVDTGAVVQNAYGTEAAEFVNPIGGGAWTDAKVNSHRYGVRASFGGTMEFRCSQVYAQIEQAVVAGGFVAIIFQWLGPLVAVGLHELPALRREVYRASGRRVWLHRHELAPCWRELREWRHRRVFDLGPAFSARAYTV